MYNVRIAIRAGWSQTVPAVARSDAFTLPKRINATDITPMLVWLKPKDRLGQSSTAHSLRHCVHRLHTVYVSYARSDLCVSVSGVGADGFLDMYRRCVFALDSASGVGMAMGVYFPVEVGSGSGVPARHSVLFVA